MKGSTRGQPQESQTHGVDVLGEQWCLWYPGAQAPAYSLLLQG